MEALKNHGVSFPAAALYTPNNMEKRMNLVWLHDSSCICSDDTFVLLDSLNKSSDAFAFVLLDSLNESSGAFAFVPMEAPMEVEFALLVVVAAAAAVVG